MKKINFIKKVTPLSADTFNQMQNNIEEEFNNVNSQLDENAAIATDKYGAVGDGVANDTEPLQTIFNTNSNVLLKGKKYKVKKLTLGDIATEEYRNPTTNQGVGTNVLIGDGGGYGTGTQIIANEVVDTLVKRNNLSGVRIEGLTLRCENLAKVGLDLSWIGPSINNAAPANLNILEKIWVEKAVDIGINLDQFHDSTIDSINVRMGTGGTDPIALSIQGGGGWVGVSNARLFGGRTRISCENGVIRDSIITKGIELTGGSYNHLNIDSCHFINLSDYAVWSNTVGNATRALSFDSCYFNALEGKGYIQGRFWSGATFRNCHFKSGKLTQNITTGAGAGVPPVFKFENCSFESEIEPPVGCIYEFVDCRNSIGRRFSYRTGGQQLNDGESTILPRFKNNGFYFETAGINVTNQAKIKEFAFLASPQDTWNTIDLDSSHNGIWLVMAYGGRGCPQAMWAICRNDINSSGNVITPIVQKNGIASPTETLEIRWQNATTNYNPEIRVTGGTVARNLVVSVIGIGGNS